MIVLVLPSFASLSAANNKVETYLVPIVRRKTKGYERNILFCLFDVFKNKIISFSNSFNQKKNVPEKTNEAVVLCSGDHPIVLFDCKVGTRLSPKE
jgi:hypothetical protein